MSKPIVYSVQGIRVRMDFTTHKEAREVYERCLKTCPWVKLVRRDTQ